MLTETHIQTGIHTGATQHIVQYQQSVTARITATTGTATDQDVCLMGFHITVVCTIKLRIFQFLHRKMVGTVIHHSRHISVGLFQSSNDFLEIEIAIHIENGIVWTIVFLSIAHGIGGLVLTKTSGFSQNITSQRLTVINQSLEFIEDNLGRRILVTVDFIADDLDLTVNFVLWIDTMKNDVRQQIYSTVEIGTEHSGIIYRLLLICESIQVTAHTFQTIGNMHGLTAFGTLEAHMLDEMRHSRVVQILVTGTCTNHITAIYDLRCGGFVNHT